MKDKTYEELVDENTALAAHVERVKEWWGDDRKRRLSLPEIREIIESSPTISLAHLKAQWQAEALEEAAELYGHSWNDEFAEVVVDIMRKGRGYVYPEGLTERATELRRQAQDPTND